jgi:putative tryptophan/tyrosine transport system substrate-binding protein
MGLMPCLTVNAETAKAVTVGILAPVQISAMTQITDGFMTTLNKLYPGKINYIVLNAQGDTNLQRSILLQFKAKQVDLVVPIGTMATQMAMSVNKTQSIIGLAAEMKNSDRAQAKNKDMTNVLDEISVTKQIEFIHAAMPQLKHLTLIYSNDDHIFPQTNEAVTVAKQYGISVQKLMMQELPDLYSISKHINKNSQAILVLKDLKIINGITTLVQQAQKRGIPLITSDDGSVSSGAAFAVGVSETQIGIDGATLAAQVLNGTAAKNIPIKIMSDYTLFVNPQAAKQQHVDLVALEATAKKFAYAVVVEK